MKVLFWLAVALFVWWAWRRAQASLRPPPAAQPPQALPHEMVSCAHCQLLLPHDEAVAGQRGQYCSTAHRSAAGDANPDPSRPAEP